MLNLQKLTFGNLIVWCKYVIVQLEDFVIMFVLWNIAVLFRLKRKLRKLPYISWYFLDFQKYICFIFLYRSIDDKTFVDVHYLFT
jgi:hypothetical protein